MENFFYTRYPNLRLHFRNAGISGDRAQDASIGSRKTSPPSSPPWPPSCWA
ncbi:hypothetical protein [Verrucomicrobium spinosum]|uniref:hypothetical protein n=1 Tax=Verrucomicrobium spinosum TaxID=2736 RepID=UPI00210D5E35|nr:hypothetical protein [Verrucomicrobium spinosum]